MEKKLILEISRLHQLMGTKSLLLENPVPKFLKKLFITLGDDIVSTSSKILDSEIDAGISKLKKGETVADDVIEKILMNLKFNNIAEIILDKKLLGSDFDLKIIQAIDYLKNNPSQYRKVITKFDDVLDRIYYLQDSPIELIDALKQEIKTKIDNSLKIPSPLKIVFETPEAVKKYFAETLNLPLDKLINVPGVNKILVDSANNMVGKSLGEVQEIVKTNIGSIESNVKFQEAFNKMNQTNKEKFMSFLNSMKEFLFVDKQKKYVFFGDRILDENGKPITNFTTSVFKTINTFLAGTMLVMVFNKWYRLGQTPGEAVTNGFNDSYLTIVGTLLGISVEKIKQKRDEFSLLTIEEAKKAFQTTATSIGKPDLEGGWSFEEISRGVIKAVDYDQIETNRIDYIIVKRGGKITILPFAETKGYDITKIEEWIDNVIKNKKSQ